MTQVTFTQTDGTQITVEANNNEHLMKLALENGVEGITGACGGSCMCATCHVSVDHVSGNLAGPGEMEEEILDMEIDNPLATSRLCCQIFVANDLNAIKVTVQEG
ncbi:MAG: 2Fe-2S iron-sulfur cluster binding domain-containing protein [Gammaproteobacteria bacterium]|jgi:2Fe-2S ferredoxin|nr:2Fe-2S iron-sulfur cluster binding domain-containing protein [Gammaproteobacteria bacterium]MCP4880361.1 2Fe-2S iron-sulfur cluster binding domain-containing protein [Gammaproteobacteria bacterium]MDP6165797.1 2Fe-2S iron-sulfur cluster-binding protein [Gammaproteobacteria bacterium]